MRLNFLRSAAAAAVLGLLSTGGLAASPRLNPIHPMGVRHVNPMHAPTYFLKEAGIVSAKNVACPSTQYYECVEISKKTPLMQEWCIVDVTSGSCSSSGDLAPGTWTWNVTNSSNKVKGDFDPNPGNPTELTISTKLKSSKPNAYTVSFTACNSSSECVGPVAIGVTVKKKIKGSGG